MTVHPVSHEKTRILQAAVRIALDAKRKQLRSETCALEDWAACHDKEKIERVLTMFRTHGRVRITNVVEIPRSR
jgi:hypothetical protein